jgi:hypothetical protein
MFTDVSRGPGLRPLVHRKTPATPASRQRNMANYAVDFSYSETASPDVVDAHMVMYSVLGVSDQLAGKAPLDHIEARLRREIHDIAQMEGLRIRGS